MKFELDDDAVLRLSTLGCAGVALHSWAAPGNFQKQMLAEKTPVSNNTAQWCGLNIAQFGVTALAVATADDANRKAKKNMLKVLGGSWATTAAHETLNAFNGDQKQAVSYGFAAGQAALAALCLWRGFKEEDD